MPPIKKFHVLSKGISTFEKVMASAWMSLEGSGCGFQIRLGNYKLEGGFPLPRGGLEGLRMNVLNEKFSTFKVKCRATYCLELYACLATIQSL